MTPLVPLNGAPVSPPPIPGSPSMMPESTYNPSLRVVWPARGDPLQASGSRADTSAGVASAGMGSWLMCSGLSASHNESLAGSSRCCSFTWLAQSGSNLQGFPHLLLLPHTWRGKQCAAVTHLTCTHILLRQIEG
jgi:hypothetical protein